jgi:hypothetical protein
MVQWKPLNVITGNVIIWLMLSHSKRPSLFVQTVQRKLLKNSVIVISFSLKMSNYEQFFW